MGGEPQQHRWRGLALALLIAIIACPARADDAPIDLDPARLKALSLDELSALEVPTVVGASKREQKITDAPSAVSVVTRTDIQEYGYRTLAELLAGVRGLDVIADRGYSFAGVRGVNRLGDFGGRTLLNVNGHRMNEPIYDSAFLEYDFPLSIDLVERVEIVRGPGSTLYGNNAVFGIVNVVTRRGRDVGGQGVEGSATYGSYDAAEGRLTYGRVFDNGVEVLVSGNYGRSNGNPRLQWTTPRFAATNGGTVEHYDGTAVGQFFGSVAYGDFTLEGVYGRREKELPNAAYGAIFNDKRTRTQDERAHLEGRYQHVAASGWSTAVRLYFDHYRYEGRYAFDYGASGIALNDDRALSRSVGGEARVSRTLWSRHRVTAGVEGRYDLGLTQENRDVSPSRTYIDLTTTQGNGGVYAQDEVQLLDSLTLHVGVRYDYYSTFGSTVNPRAALLYTPRRGSTFKVLYGQAYRAPAAYEVSYENTTYKANANLRPETIRTYELVWEQAIARHYRLTASLYYNQISDLITQGTNPDPADRRFVFQNTDAVTVKGGELEMIGSWENGLRARASYSFAEAIDDATGRVIANAPKHLGKAQLTVPLWPHRVFAGLEVLASSDRQTGRGRTLPARAIANFTLFGRELFGGLDVSASIYNLFDKTYVDPASPDFVQDINPRDGRTFRLKLTYRF